MSYIEVNGTEIHYIEQGPEEAPTLVFSHSMFFDVKMFEAQARALPWANCSLPPLL
ncbi:alpha/beta fold hydrolase [Kineobactrum salinum]|uniref:Alpha/beta hydrolase n=1 Tax=Kineobactrum salinum TaxID=2708301 RepID=A0A6C0U289_9GAMM|nr:hypothetical protein [Kineobactrum salinum]QIB65097.1 hypothetical protein G3T16_06470 [Kineobactrum salinum]